MGLITYGLNFVVRGGANFTATISRVSQVMGVADRAIKNHVKSINNGTKVNAAMAASWNKVNQAVGGVTTAFTFLARTFQAVLSVFTAGFVTWVGTGLLLKQMADAAIGTAKAFAGLGLAAVNAAETVASKVHMIRGRIGDSLGKMVASAALDTSKTTGLAFDEIISTTNMFLNNPEVGKMIKAELTKGNTEVINDLAIMLKQIQITNPDIAARMGVMLPNILGGSAQSFKFGFEVTPEQAEQAIKEYFGGTLPSGVSAAGFRGGKGLDAFKFVENYLETLAPRSSIEKMAYMFSSQTSVLGGAVRGTVARAMGADEDNIGVVGTLGRILSTISGKILGMLDAGGLDEIGRIVAEKADVWGARISNILGYVFAPLDNAKTPEDIKTGLKEIGTRLTEIVKGLAVVLTGLFQTLMNALSQTFLGPIASKLVNLTDIGISFFLMGMDVLSALVKFLKIDGLAGWGRKDRLERVGGAVRDAWEFRVGRGHDIVKGNKTAIDKREEDEARKSVNDFLLAVTAERRGQDVSKLKRDLNAGKFFAQMDFRQTKAIYSTFDGTPEEFVRLMLGNNEESVNRVAGQMFAQRFGENALERRNMRARMDQFFEGSAVVPTMTWDQIMQPANVALERFLKIFENKGVDVSGQSYPASTGAQKSAAIDIVAQGVARGGAKAASMGPPNVQPMPTLP